MPQRDNTLPSAVSGKAIFPSLPRFDTKAVFGDTPSYFDDCEEWLNELVRVSGPVVNANHGSFVSEIYQYMDGDLCEHEPVVVHFVQSNGVVVYQQQCRRCWKKLTSALKHDSLTDDVKQTCPERVGYEQTRWAKTGIRLALFSQLNRLQVHELTESELWWAEYNEYLLTPEWKRLQQAAFKRDHYLCQMCLTGPAEHAHHLTYKRVKHERLFDIVSLCTACHQREHPGKEL